MWRLQFVLCHSGNSSLAYPREAKGTMSLTHSIFDCVLYGSEDLAIEDVSRWCVKFPEILSAEAIRLVGIAGEAS